MKKKKKSNFKFDRNILFTVVIVFVILHNSYIHINSDVKKYYKENISRLEKDFLTFKKSVMVDIVKEIIILTNYIGSSSLPVNSIASGQTAFKVPYKDTTLEYSTGYTTITNIPNFTFDSVCRIDNDYIAQFNDYFYRVGDRIHGYEILDISPMFVNVGGRMFPVGKKERIQNYDIRKRNN